MTQRVIQMGEESRTVFNVGEPGVENILNTNLMSLEEINKSLNFELKEKEFAVVTYHPETICDIPPREQIKILLDFIGKHPELNYIITKSNIDEGGDLINEYIEEWSKSKDNVKFVASLGRIRYLSCVKHALLVIGNSSSGLLEVPYLLTPTINIGNRQQGRECEASVITCKLEAHAIEEAFKLAKSKPCTKDELNFVYGTGDTSNSVVEQIIKSLKGKNVSKKKIFNVLEIK